MDAQRRRNALFGGRLVKNLKQRHFDAYYCDTRQQLVELVRALIPEGASVSWGGSASIRETGVTAMLKAGNYKVHDRDDVTTDADKVAVYRQAFACDWYLSSVNAMSEDGQLVNVDANGNRVAAIAWGPEHVLLVVGVNKVCRDLDAAVKRARGTAAPVNMARFEGARTPCKEDGVCHDCKSPDSICCCITVQRLSRPAGRHTVVVVGEDLGF